ncbi:hypothetical protein PoB_000091100 [Plakobranchus ocellatus]|uniref:Uncharacterized protein n=1 Tax=Plakobranchus ocellatus TaxID=259542 RepID=A0AAV3WWC9_9GAST|nr:hypothetical protein PoB_000091100 [Plakobranchus ocellatus]
MYDLTGLQGTYPCLWFLMPQRSMYLPSNQCQLRSLESLLTDKPFIQLEKVRCTNIWCEYKDNICISNCPLCNHYLSLGKAGRKRKRSRAPHAETTEDAHILSAQVAETAESLSTSYMYSQNACSSISLASTPKESCRRLILETNPGSSSKPAFTTSRSTHIYDRQLNLTNKTSNRSSIYTILNIEIGQLHQLKLLFTKNKPPMIAHTLIDH